MCTYIQQDMIWNFFRTAFLRNYNNIYETREKAGGRYTSQSLTSSTAERARAPTCLFSRALWEHHSTLRNQTLGKPHLWLRQSLDPETANLALLSFSLCVWPLLSLHFWKLLLWFPTISVCIWMAPPKIHLFLLTGHMATSYTRCSRMMCVSVNYIEKWQCNF